MGPMERFAKQAVDALNQILPELGLEPVAHDSLETPKDAAQGDFAFPCFRLAKVLKKAPPQLAQEVVTKLTEKNTLPAGMAVAAAGPYVNFTADGNTALKSLLKDILAGAGNGDYGRYAGPARGTWVIEYSSPNVAKPFMIYHFRPTGLGACLDRVGRYRGFKMVSINHLGDWGTQFGKLYVALKMFEADLPAEPKINDLVKIYVKLHEAIEKDPAIEDQARAAFKRLEQRDPDVVASWKRCLEISMKEFNRLYDSLDVKFDHIWGESFYEEQLRPLLAKLKEMGILVPSEGAWVANVTDAQGRELTPCILEKSDGSTIYATRDVAALLYRWEKFQFDRMTYVVGGEQKLHFQQVFGVVRKMGNAWVDRCEHIPTGLYRFKDSKMSTRKGNFVTLADVWEMAMERVNTLVRGRIASDVRGTQKYSEAEIADICEKVAIGAIVFNDLSSDPSRDVEFDVERVVDFEGETGPYLQYAHTRCLSILRKANATTIAYDERLVSKLTAKEEVALVKTLGQFPHHLERTLTHGKASQLANFLIDVTKAFGAFYRECQVLGDDPELTRARLMMVESTRRVLAHGLKLIGIPVPERM